MTRDIAGAGCSRSIVIVLCAPRGADRAGAAGARPVLRRQRRASRSLNLAFFTEMPRPVGETGGGMANAIVGSLIVTRLGALFAIPIGIMSGIYAAEYAGTRLASTPRGSPPTRSTACRRSSSASSSTASPCCRSGASRRWPAASRSAS